MNLTAIADEYVSQKDINISPLSLSIHLLILQVEPDELPLLHPATSSEEITPGKGLSSHAVAHTVLSVLRRFTTVFGMGTGGSNARYHQGIRFALSLPCYRRLLNTTTSTRSLSRAILRCISNLQELSWSYALLMVKSISHRSLGLSPLIYAAMSWTTVGARLRGIT